MKKIMIMLSRLFLLNFVLSLFAETLYSQKKTLDHSVYDKWQSISSCNIPYNGKYLFYSIDEQEGNNTLYIRDMQSNKTITVPRGNKVVVSKNGKRAVCLIKPFYKETKDAKIAKKKDFEMPQDTLAVINLATRAIIKYPHVENFAFGCDLKDFLVIRLARASKSDKEVRPLCILNLKTMEIDTIEHVKNYKISDCGERLIYTFVPEGKDSSDTMEMHFLKLAEWEDKIIFSCNKKGYLSVPYINKSGTKVVFYAQPDTSKEKKETKKIFFADLANEETAFPIITNDTDGISEGLEIDYRAKLKFGFNDKYILFGLKNISKKKNDSVPDFEKVDLTVWVWNNDFLPTMENASKNYLNSQSYSALYYFDISNKIIPLADKELPTVYIPDDFKGDRIFSLTDKHYRIAQQWDAVSRYDAYEVNLKNGFRNKLSENCRYTGFSSSPDGRYTVYFNVSDSSWYLYDIIEKDLRNLTASLPAIFWDDEKDMPRPPYQNGQVLWYSDGSAVCIGSKYDVWKFDPTGKIPAENLTDGIGVANFTKFDIVKRLCYDDGLKSLSGVPIENFILSDAPIFFSSFNTKTKETGIYVKNKSTHRTLMVKLTEGKFTYKLLGMINYYEYPDFVKNKHSKAKTRKKLDIPILIYSKGNFENPNDLYFTKNYFKTETKITDINPQQDDYIWGTAELVKWKIADDKEAEGILYKPENFDSKKKYPMIVYFYERHSNELYMYKNPAPSHSTINIPFCVSNGYIVFVPNVYYEIGHPGHSAMNSIMPGVDMLCKNSWINNKKMALQGQSWGGYQTAYMITQTDRFTAAAAGAPVSNMTSAYGGIRWESGSSRQFQYESTQSRIGKDLWNGFNLYVENSPLFFVPNVKTSILIMHNDGDGAVPWYQGIEFFTSLRRCGKKAWMLQYKNEAHNLRKRHNCKDYSIKLMEFFGYYLKDTPMPDWMKTK